MDLGDFGIVSETGVAYTSGDMTLTDNPFTASNVVTPKGASTLKFTVWLSAAKTMYLHDSDGNDGAIGVTLGADAPASWEMPWDPSRTFSIRFSGAVTVRKLIINGR